MTLTNTGSNEISIGTTGFIAEASAWNKAQSERAGQLPELISEKGVTTIRVVYSDQHGLMRGKALSVDNFLLALQNGVADTFSNLGKDTSNTPVSRFSSTTAGSVLSKWGVPATWCLFRTR